MCSTMCNRTLIAFATAAGLLLTTVSVASAETITMKATLNAAAEVPANDSKGAGTADVVYDTATKVLTWKVSYSGLTGPATMAHFHGPADAGKNAAITVPFANPVSGAEGSATLTDAQATDLLAGRYYINVHTDANKGGEIRGQVMR